MADKRAIVLDGSRTGDEDLAPFLAILVDELRSNGIAVQTYTLREFKLGHCVGCFGCWIETPGICVQADAGHEIIRAMIRSDMTVLFTPVTFGGYSSELKKVVDRWIPVMLPYFGNYHGEIRHKPRYPKFPRLVGIGVQRDPNSEEARIFKAVVGRNALNVHAPSYAAEVIMSPEDLDSFPGCLKAFLSRVDPLPLAEALTSLGPVPDISIASRELGRPGRVLLIVGSPKTKSPSTSGVLGGYALERFRELGWETDSLTLGGALLQERGEQDLFSLVDRADLVLLAPPLYIDTLPFLVTRALEVIAVHRRGRHQDPPLRLSVLLNNGFPEAYQSTLALAICHRFAVQSGMRWAGGLAVGAGEALSSGPSLTSRNRSGLPVSHVIKALNMAAAYLAEGQPLPSEAVAMIARNPIPLLPFAAWRWIFAKVGTRRFQQQAAANGISRKNLLTRPYVE